MKQNVFTVSVVCERESIWPYTWVGRIAQFETRLFGSTDGMFLGRYRPYTSHTVHADMHRHWELYSNRMIAMYSTSFEIILPTVFAMLLLVKRTIGTFVILHLYT